MHIFKSCLERTDRLSVTCLLERQHCGFSDFNFSILQSYTEDFGGLGIGDLGQGSNNGKPDPAMPIDHSLGQRGQCLRAAVSGEFVHRLPSGFSAAGLKLLLCPPIGHG
jgi:hypothetical protein